MISDYSKSDNDPQQISRKQFGGVITSILRMASVDFLKALVEIKYAQAYYTKEEYSLIEQSIQKLSF